MKRILIAAFWFLSIPMFGQVSLSPQAEVRVITFGPYQGELYSAFGHSGIRVYDPERGINDFYNYGIFDFDQPNFYLNFARGYLNYRLAVMPYPNVANYYASQDRYIHEQVLNLDSLQKQKLFDFLVWNAQPENMYYYYDYFYDNCATRVIDAVEQMSGAEVSFDGSYITTDYTLRDLTDIYLQEQPWGDVGIDICLGLPMDKKATPRMYTFLPDYLESAFDNAFIIRDGKKIPLVAKTIITYEKQGIIATPKSLVSPMTAFILLLVIGCILTFYALKKNKSLFWFDALLFSIIGLIGWLLFVLWVATDHAAAAKNMNLLWAIPFHFPMGLLLLRKGGKKIKLLYFSVVSVLMVVLIICWAFLPQNLHEVFIPLSLLVIIRSLYIRFYLKRISTL